MIIYSGPAGAGKTTQAKMLAKETGYEHISVGNLLREKTTGEYKDIMETGGLLPSAYVEATVEEGLSSIEDPKNVILDGFPRDFPEARWIFENYGPLIEHLVLIEITEEETMKRLLKRGRRDDKPEAIKKRLEIYREETDGIITYFEEQMVPISRIDGSGTPEEVHALTIHAFYQSEDHDDGSSIASQAEDEAEAAEAEA